MLPFETLPSKLSNLLIVLSSSEEIYSSTAACAAAINHVGKPHFSDCSKHSFNNWTFAYQEVKGVKTYVLLLKKLRQKDFVLTPLTPLTPLTSELAKLELTTYAFLSTISFPYTLLYTRTLLYMMPFLTCSQS